MDLFPALAALMQWGARWLDDDGGPVELRHHDCAGKLEVQLRCACQHEVRPGELGLVAREA